MQGPKIAMLSNNKATRTRTVSNGAGYSRSTWVHVESISNGRNHQRDSPCHSGQKQFYDDLVPSQIVQILS
jgi:hypothetical protein